MRKPAPAGVNSIEYALRHRRALEQFEVFLPRAAAGRAADALTFVHAETGSGDLSERFTQERIETACFESGEPSWIERNISVLKKERRRVPDQPGRLPDVDEGKLLRKTFWIGGRRETFARQDRRRRVMAVRLVVVRTEARHDDVRFPFPNRPDNVGQDFFAVPNLQRFGRAFRKTEIDGPGKELVRVIDLARGEKFVSADKTEPLAQLRPEKILPAIAARNRKISRVVERAVRPERHQVGVLIVGMRGDIEDAPEDIQLLERELNLGCVHRRRKIPRWRFRATNHRRAHEHKAQRAANNSRSPITHERYTYAIDSTAQLFIDVLLRVEPIDQRLDRVLLLIGRRSSLRFLRVFSGAGKIARGRFDSRV